MKKKTIIFIISAVILLILAILFGQKSLKTEPVISVKERAVLKISDVVADKTGEEIVCDVNLSALGDELYPAASFVIDFDKTKLEFISVDEGNILIPSEIGEELPKWSYNAEKANDEGQIKIMYLDITGGMKAFSKEYVLENGVLFRLRFKVYGSASAGEEIPLSFSDAVFAANDEEKSLSMVSNTLKANGGSVKIGG